MINKEIFREIGLTENETEVYLILLKENESIASNLSTKTKISRPHVYDSLNKLIHKGMVSYIIKDKKKYFRPTPTEKILNYIREEEMKIHEKKRRIIELMPELNAISNKKEETPRVEVYEGAEGIKMILNDIIKEGKEMLAFNTLGEELLEYVPEHILKDYLKERKRKKIKSRQFYVKNAKILGHEMVAYKELPNQFIPITLFVYGSNVVMFNITKPILVIKICSPTIAKFHKNQFETMWKLIK